MTLKKKNGIRKVMALCLALMMAFSLMVSAMATDVTVNPADTTAATTTSIDAATTDEGRPETPSNTDSDDQQDRSVGDTLVYETASFVNSTTVTLNLPSGNWSADCLVRITGNAGAMYEVKVTTPGGSTTVAYIYSNTGYNLIESYMYASPGPYTVQATRISGSAVTVSLSTKLCD